MIHFLFQIINFVHVYDCQSHQTCDQVMTEKCWNRCQNRRENVPLIVVVVGDHTSKISRNKLRSTVMFKTVCDLSAITQTDLTWSYHQSREVAQPVVRAFVSSSRTISSSTSHKLFRLVVRPFGDASHDLHLQWLATIGGTCKHVITKDWRR